MRGVNGIHSRLYPLGKEVKQTPGTSPKDGGGSFQKILEEARESLDVKLSKHAQIRMQHRNIVLNSSHVQRLNSALKKAREKGIRDTLVLMDDKVFVVNIESTTVITAADRASLKDKVFTNIDGAVIV